MPFLYHAVPKNLTGTTLYPLNTLKHLLPEIYHEHVKKYAGREYLLEREIPTLNCLWNDVLHLCAIHPSKIKDALIRSGKRGDFNLASYEIDPSLLDSKNLTVYLPKNESSQGMYIPYRHEDLEHYAEVPQKTLDVYRDAFQNQKKPLLYAHIPHILYKGNISTPTLKKVSS